MCLIPIGGIVLYPAGASMELQGGCWVQQLTAGDRHEGCDLLHSLACSSQAPRDSAVPSAQGAAAGALAGRSAKAQAL